MAKAMTLVESCMALYTDRLEFMATWKFWEPATLPPLPLEFNNPVINRLTEAISAGIRIFPMVESFALEKNSSRTRHRPHTARFRVTR